MTEMSWCKSVEEEEIIVFGMTIVSNTTES